MKVFIFEHICGGGMAGEELTSRLVWEGGAMLRAVVEDFVALGVEVTTTLDRRVTLELGGAKVTRVEPGSAFEPVFDQFCGQADAAVLIAPEFHNLLENWSSRAKKAGVRLLGCDPQGVATVSDKHRLASHLLGAGVPTPSSVLGLCETPAEFPVIVKPRFGAGCERTFVCRSREEMDRLPAHDDWIVQPFAAGVASSAAFLVEGSTIRPLQAGEQFIRGKQQLFYHGGRMPLPPELSRRALVLGEKAIRTVPGLRGYVGVDLVMGASPELDRVIEINPRLTVAYVGLRKLCLNNLASAILDPAAPLAWGEGVLSFDASGQFSWEGVP